MPSTNASTPAGFVATTSVPVGASVTGGGSAQKRRAPITPTAPITLMPAANDAATFHSFLPGRRPGFVKPLPAPSPSADAAIAFSNSAASLAPAAFGPDVDPADEALTFGSCVFSSSGFCTYGDGADSGTIGGGTAETDLATVAAVSGTNAASTVGVVSGACTATGGT